MTPKEKVKSFDWIGTAFLMPCIVCLLLALQWGGSTYAWKSWRIIFLLVLAIILVCAFIGAQFYQGEKATLPIRIVSQRTVAFGALSSFSVSILKYI